MGFIVSLRHFSVGVAADEYASLLQLCDAGDGLFRQRAPYKVSTEGDHVNVQTAHLFEHSLERWKVPVDVIKRRHTPSRHARR